jgi:hypothetical protein
MLTDLDPLYPGRHRTALDDDEARDNDVSIMVAEIREQVPPYYGLHRTEDPA